MLAVCPAWDAVELEESLEEKKWINDSEMNTKNFQTRSESHNLSHSESVLKNYFMDSTLQDFFQKHSETI